MTTFLHAAITETLAEHRSVVFTDDGRLVCAGAGDVECGWTPDDSDLPGPWDAHDAHVAERVLAVLAGRLPHTPPDQLAGLIGGQAESAAGWSRVEGPWVPDSPPAAPEPRQDT